MKRRAHSEVNLHESQHSQEQLTIHICCRLLVLAGPSSDPLSNPIADTNMPSSPSPDSPSPSALLPFVHTR